ncbi:MAG: hypothetical protein HC908_17710 [Calothrix sp. SM1_7_51]|nr:hypothetical protein [Calothrix sp. SM1_7_51]
MVISHLLLFICQGQVTEGKWQMTPTIMGIEENCSVVQSGLVCVVDFLSTYVYARDLDCAY